MVAVVVVSSACIREGVSKEDVGDVEEGRCCPCRDDGSVNGAAQDDRACTNDRRVGVSIALALAGVVGAAVTAAAAAALVEEAEWLCWPPHSCLQRHE